MATAYNSVSFGLKPDLVTVLGSQKIPSASPEREMSEKSPSPFKAETYFNPLDDNDKTATKSEKNVRTDKLAIDEFEPPLSTLDNDRFYLNYVR